MRKDTEYSIFVEDKSCAHKEEDVFSIEEQSIRDRRCSEKSPSLRQIDESGADQRDKCFDIPYIEKIDTLGSIFNRDFDRELESYLMNYHQLNPMVDLSSRFDEPNASYN